VIDPENEYRPLTEKVDGTYVNISINSDQHINPFDLPPKIEDIDYAPGDLLRSQILNLISLITVLVGGITPSEEALLDKALQATYALKEITLENDDPTGKSFPLMQDLLHVLEGMDG
jgi:type IV secretory pathway VirB4 component